MLVSDIALVLQDLKPLTQATTMAMRVRQNWRKQTLRLFSQRGTIRASTRSSVRRYRRYQGCEHLIGCSGMGVLTSDGEFEGKSVVAVLVLRSDQLSALSFCVSEDGDVAGWYNHTQSNTAGTA